MPIQDTDLLLIQDTSDVSKSITASKLKANLAANTYNNHRLLVNKPDGSSFFVFAQNMQASVSPTDLMLVQRGDTSYQITGQQLIDYFPSAPAGAAGEIIDVEDAGEFVYTIGPIASVEANILLDTWSNYWNVNYGAPAFDGDCTLWTYPAANETMIWEPTNPIPFSTLRIGAFYSKAESPFYVNEIEVTQFVEAYDGGNQFITDEQLKSVGITSPLFKISIQNTSALNTTASCISCVEVDGQVMTDGVAFVSPPVLTFSTNDNFDKFQVGDVLQDGAPLTDTWSSYGNGITYGGYPQTNAFNGNTGAQNGVLAPNASSSWVWEYPTGIPFSTIKLWGSKYSTITNNSLKINGVSVTNSTSFPNWTAMAQITPAFESDIGDRLYKIEINGWPGVAIAGIELDGQLLRDNVEGPWGRVSIIDIDADEGSTPPVPTITVDGGSWLGADGTGDAGGVAEVTKTVVYEEKLTLASDDNLDTFTGGDAINMIDNNGDVASYTPVTNTIRTVEYTTDARNVTLTFEDTIAENPDLKYFSPGDLIGYETIDEAPSGYIPEDSSSGVRFEDDNFTVGGNSLAQIGAVGSPIPVSNARKVYWEIDILSYHGESGIGVTTNFYTKTDGYAGASSNNGWMFTGNRGFFGRDFTDNGVPAIELGKTYGIALDTATGQAWVSVDGVWIHNPESDGPTVSCNSVASTKYTHWRINSRAYSTSTEKLAKTPRYPVPDGFDSVHLVTESAEVISTDIANNQMVVRGGFWQGSDGSNNSIIYGYVCHKWSLNAQTFATPNGELFDKVEFASYGNPTGGCPFPEYGSCHLALSQSKAESKLLGVSSESLHINDFLQYGDPCHGTTKHCIVSARFSRESGTANFQTEVTGPSKSGRGNFLSFDGTDVAVSNSNSEWIDSKNRLGEKFFIKPPSSRTGLAVLRAKAIVSAEAWVADAGYLAQQVVKHNGRYWFAVSSNYANSPDETDTADWFDLGPIE